MKSELIYELTPLEVQSIEVTSIITIIHSMIITNNHLKFDEPTHFIHVLNASLAFQTQPQANTQTINNCATFKRFFQRQSSRPPFVHSHLTMPQ